MKHFDWSRLTVISIYLFSLAAGAALTALVMSVASLRQALVAASVLMCAAALYAAFGVIKELKKK